MESQPLLGSANPSFTCPGCRSIQMSPTSRPPAWLRCSRCHTRFIANIGLAKSRLRTYILVGLILLAVSVGITAWSVDEATRHGGVYYMFYGGIFAGCVFLIRGAVGLCLLHRVERVCRSEGVRMPGLYTTLTGPYLAAKQGNLAELQRAVSQGFDINSKSPERITCLQYASQQGHFHIVQYLIANGASVNQRGSKSCPLLEAAANGHLDIVRELINNGADEHVTTISSDKQGNPLNLTALILACVRGHADVAHLLLTRNHNPNQKPQGCNPPLLCASKGGFQDVITVLLQHNANVNIQNTRGQTALHLAVENNRADAIRLLLRLGADPSIRNASGVDPLAMARGQNKMNLVKIFMQQAELMATPKPPPYSAMGSDHTAQSSVNVNYSSSSGNNDNSNMVGNDSFSSSLIQGGMGVSSSAAATAAADTTGIGINNATSNSNLNSSVASGFSQSTAPMDINLSSGLYSNRYGINGPGSDDDDDDDDDDVDRLPPYSATVGSVPSHLAGSAPY